MTTGDGDAKDGVGAIEPDAAPLGDDETRAELEPEEAREGEGATDAELAVLGVADTHAEREAVTPDDSVAAKVVGTAEEEGAFDDDCEPRGESDGASDGETMADGDVDCETVPDGDSELVTDRVSVRDADAVSDAPRD